MRKVDLSKVTGFGAYSKAKKVWGIYTFISPNYRTFHVSKNYGNAILFFRKAITNQKGFALLISPMGCYIARNHHSRIFCY